MLVAIIKEIDPVKATVWYSFQQMATSTNNTRSFPHVKATTDIKQNDCLDQVIEPS